MLYEEACTGCRACRPPVVFEPPAWRWWHILTGPPRYKEPEGQQLYRYSCEPSCYSCIAAKKDYSGVVNENCGRIREVDLKGTDLIIENNLQEVRENCHETFVEISTVNS